MTVTPRFYTPSEPSVPPRVPRVTDTPHAPFMYGTMLLAILVAAFAIRALDLNFNSAFGGESFNVLMGKSVLARGTDVPQYLRESYGWYLWPIAAAVADRIGGLTAVRLLAAVLGTAAVYGIFAFTRRLFDERTGLVAALLMAVFAPAILSSRIATSDAPGMATLTFALAAFVRAWRGDRVRWWLVAAVLTVLCVLIKHTLIVIIPPLCITAIILNRKYGLGFAAVVAGTLIAYGIWYHDAAGALLSAVSNATGVRAANGALLEYYLRNGVDIWFMVAAALAAWIMSQGDRRVQVTILALSALLLALSPLARAFDPHAWSFTVYPVILLIPAAALGVLAISDRLVMAEGVLSALFVIIVAASVFLVGGQGLTPTRGGLPVVWPNSAVVATFLRERIQYGQRVLVDDAAVRYLLTDLTPQDRVADEQGYTFGGYTAPESFARAVAIGHFDYIVLDGNNADEARALQAAIDPSVLNRYVERLRTLQPNTGVDAIVYERVLPPVTRAPDAPSIIIESPQPGATIVAGGTDPGTVLTGHVDRVPRGARMRFDVYTDNWYLQGTITELTDPSGRFAQRMVLAGEGGQRCTHLLRVRLLGDNNRILDEALISGVKRAAADSVNVPCP